MTRRMSNGGTERAERRSEGVDSGSQSRCIQAGLIKRQKREGCRGKSWFRAMARMHISPAGSLMMENLKNKALYVS